MADTMPETASDEVDSDSAEDRDSPKEWVPEQAPEGNASAPEQIELEKVRIVDIERKETGEVLRRDCYDPDGGPAEIGDVMRLKDGELYLRTIDWAKSKSEREEPTLRWEATGLTQEEVCRIGIFTWPAQEPVRIFADE
jgi:hypothetical protein